MFSLRHPLTVLSFWVKPQSRVPKSSGKQRRLGNAGFSVGWPSMTDGEQQRRKRHSLQQDDTRVLCCQEPETISHLLIGCSFSRQVWYRLFRHARWQLAAPQLQDDIFADWWLAARKRFGKVDRKCFDSLVLLTFWIIWKERNRRTFDHVAEQIEAVVLRIFEEISDWIQAGFSSLNIFLSLCGHQIPDRRGRVAGRAIVTL